MDHKLQQALEQTLKESEMYIEKINMILASFGIVTIICLASLLYSFDVWTLVGMAMSIVVIAVAIFKKRQLFNDLTKLTESEHPEMPH